MITRAELDAKALEFGIHQSNVQRDYVFGWLLYGIFSASGLSDALTLKGGNCFRKAYFPNTRFSRDLDFSAEGAINEDFVRHEFNRACRFVQDRAGVVFDLNRSRVEVQSEIDSRRRVFDVRLYFSDFYGYADHINISLSIDIVEFDKLFLPVQIRRIIHPYSDASECSGFVRCVKLEEMLASKLKCMLQRRSTSDLFDLVYSVFVNRDLAVNRQEIVTTFLRRTIYERSPGVARQLLVDLPLAGLRTAWDRYIVAPLSGLIEFDQAVEYFQSVIGELFGSFPIAGRTALAYFPSSLRSPILEAGSERRLLKINYDGVLRVVEPYALTFKRRKDGHGEEYLYVFDRTGGRSSGPGIKSLVNQKIRGIEVLEDHFEPRYPIELGKAGEFVGRGYFVGNGLGGRARSGSTFRALRHGWRYTVECSYCNRKFRRMRRSTTLKAHKDEFGNGCFGRRGVVVDQQLV